jgi:glycosyltransferase involved in cell wall biosynthesis
MAILFWLAVAAVLYPYFIYPGLLWVLGLGRRPRPSDPDAALPSVTMIVPVSNEEARIARKVANTAALSYPADRLQVLFISDGSTDRTAELARAHATPLMTVVELPVRQGKAAGLNAGIQLATNDIVVFTDASIELEAGALRSIVRQFQDPGIGCVSGEDRIAESGGEAWYGRYELLVRRLESSVHSIAGASGSFYAQRRSLCRPFTEGMAPDFLSVLRTIEQGFRAVGEPNAVGAMTSVKNPQHEFERKVRTVIRGMTALFACAPLLNPFRYGAFSFVLWSHKIGRWTAPVFLLLVFLASLALRDMPFYAVALAAQVAFYACAAFAFAQWGQLHRSKLGKLALYFCSVNVAIAVAWYRYATGTRLEIWAPSQR